MVILVHIVEHVGEGYHTNSQDAGPSYWLDDVVCIHLIRNAPNRHARATQCQDLPYVDTRSPVQLSDGIHGHSWAPSAAEVFDVSCLYAVYLKKVGGARD